MRGNREKDPYGQMKGEGKEKESGQGERKGMGPLKLCLCTGEVKREGESE